MDGKTEMLIVEIKNVCAGRAHWQSDDESADARIDYYCVLHS